VVTAAAAAKQRERRKADLDRCMESALDILVENHGAALADIAKIVTMINGTADITVCGVALAGPLQGRKVNLTITIDPID
jgi:hypothetical protein